MMIIAIRTADNEVEARRLVEGSCESGGRVGQQGHEGGGGGHQEGGGAGRRQGRRTRKVLRDFQGGGVRDARGNVSGA